MTLTHYGQPPYAGKYADALCNLGHPLAGLVDEAYLLPALGWEGLVDYSQ